MSETQAAATVAEAPFNLISSITFLFAEVLLQEG